MSAQAEAIVCDAEALLAARRLQQAMNRFQHAEAAGADPDRCAAGLWTVHMLQGNFEAAWRESDAIRGRGKPDPHRFWQGESLHGKRVMLRCLHGFGDAVQFLRFVPQLRDVTRSLVVEVPPRLVELTRCFEGIEDVVTWGHTTPVKAPAWDVQIEITELPYLFRTHMSELPLLERYLTLPEQRRTHLGDLEAFRVGLVWTAGDWNPERSIPFSTVRPLLQVTGCEFWSLESMPAEQDSAAAENSAPIRQDAASRESILRLAEIISQLNLVITVDTLAAHLAGALGVPCWILLQHEADWRWMHGRNDSPWYPTVRLFRQPSAGDWKSVIVSAQHALQRHVSALEIQLVSKP